MSTKERPNLLSKEEWEGLDRKFYVLKGRVLDIHHMIYYYFGKREQKLVPLQNLHVSLEEVKSVFDTMIHMDFMDKNARHLKPGVDWDDCPSTGDRYLTIFYNHDLEFVSSYKPYDLGLKKPKKLQRWVPTDDKVKFLKDLNDLEKLIRVCRKRLRTLIMTDSSRRTFDDVIPEIEACKSAVSSLPEETDPNPSSFLMMLA
jgi:hypothetical protein